MPDLIDRFCASYHDYHDISDERRTMQRRVLHQLEASVNGTGLAGVSAEGLRSYLETRRATCAATTVRKELLAITPFLRWAWREKLIDGERYMELRDVAPPRGGTGSLLPRPYSRKEQIRFWQEFNAAYPPCDTKFLERWQRETSRWCKVQPYAKRVQLEAIIAGALYAGARRNEWFRMTEEDVHPDNAYLVIRGARKNERAEELDRVVPWNGLLKDAITRWLELRALLDPPHDSLWLSLHQHHYLKPLRHRQFKVLLTHIGRGYEFHRMRHTYATERLRAGLPIDKLQRELGHTHISMTMRYVQLLEGDIVKAGEKVDADYTRSMMRLRAAA